MIWLQVSWLICVAATLPTNEALSLVSRGTREGIPGVPCDACWQAQAGMPPPPVPPAPPVPAAMWANPFLEGGARVLPTPTPLPTVRSEAIFAPPPPLPSLEAVGVGKLNVASMPSSWPQYRPVQGR
mmetsp:Transcript_595/g.1220  ORF Transcript_595/g.1220 Transcript_595/m.1220 type:complete len:127 (-) Transcript_595:238-618(-)